MLILSRKLKLITKKLLPYTKCIFFSLLVVLVLSNFEQSFNIKIIGLRQVTALLKHFQVFIILFTTISGFIAIRQNIESVKVSEKISGKWTHTVIIILILIYAGLLIYPNLGGHDLYHDEQYHKQVLDSLGAGDGFHLRNYVLNEPTREYQKAYLTNVCSYIFYSFSPNSHFLIRFFAATMGLFSIIIIYLAFKEFCSKSVALLATFMLANNIIFLYLARFLRPYTSFLCLYMLIFYLIVKTSTYIRLGNTRKACLSTIGIIIFSLLAISEREVAEILFVILPMCFLAIAINYRETIKSIFLRHKKTFLLVFLPVIIGLVFLLDLLNFIHISNISAQITDNFSLKLFAHPTVEYYSYLFKNQIKNTALAYTFFLIGLLYIIFSYKHKNTLFKYFLIIFTIVPLFFSIYLLDRYEDFRYILHIIPFVILFIVLGIYLTVSLFFKKEFARFVFSLIVTLIFAFTPTIPFLKASNIFADKAISEWAGNDGDTYLHRRAVPPEYTKAYIYLNAYQKSGDIVLVNEALWNLDPIEGVGYYSMDYAKINSHTAINLKNNDNVEFQKLANKPNKRLWYLGAYVHKTDDSVNEYLLKKCKNISGELGIAKFNYFPYYQNRFYWPNLFLCE